MPVLFGGVVHQHVQAAEFLHGAAHNFGAEGGLLEVAGQQDAASAFGFDQGQGFFGILLLGGEVADGYVGPFAGKMHRHGPADAGIGPGDEGDFALELVGPLVAFADVLRLGGHFVFEAGLASARVLVLGRENGGVIGHFLVVRN